MRKLVASLFALVMLAAMTFVFVPAASAGGSDAVCIHLVTAAQKVDNPQALPEQSILYQCTVVPD